MKHLWRLFLGWLRWKWEARRSRRAAALAGGIGEPTHRRVTKPAEVEPGGGAASPLTLESHAMAVVNAESESHDTDAEWAEFEADPRLQSRFRAAWLNHERAKARGEVP